MPTAIEQVTTTAFIPTFAPRNTLWYAADTGDLWIGTGFSIGSDFTPGNPGPNINIEQITAGGGTPGGFNGDIQYNNNGAFGGSAASITAAGAIVALSLTSTTVTSTAFDFLGVLVDTTGTVGASGQFLETTSTGVKWATVAAGGSTWAALTGDLTSTQVIPFDGNVVGTPDTGISRLSSGVIGIGTGSSTSTAGGLILTTATVASTLLAAAATITNGFYAGSLVTPAATITSATVTSTLVAAAATVTNGFYAGSLVTPAATITSATVTSTLSLSSANEILTSVSVAPGASISTAGYVLLQNTTPTVTGASTTVALSTSTAPSNSGGNTWVYTLAASESGAGSSGWVGASVTLSGYTGGATGNNVTAIITASTTTSITITNATGTATNTGTPVAISSAVINSPILQFAGTINSGTAGVLNSIADTWSIQNVIGSVAPNPTSILTFTHAGSSGSSIVSVPSIGVTAGTGPCSVCNPATPTSGQEITGSTTYFVNASTQFVGIGKNTTNMSVMTGSAGGYAFSSGTNPASSNADTTISRNAAGIVQIGTTAANASGNLAANSFAANGVVASPAAGVYYSGGTAGVSAGPFGAITSIQTIGGIVTTLADVSDERLKDHSPYIGGLKEVLGITPIKYAWNSEGQKITGFSKDRLFIGFRAQDIQKVIPEAVTQSASNPKYLGFDDRPVIAALVNAVKELSAKNDDLEIRLANIEKWRHTEEGKK